MEGGECLQTMRNPMLKSAITVIGIIALFRLWESPYKILWWSILALLVMDWLSAETEAREAGLNMRSLGDKYISHLKNGGSCKNDLCLMDTFYICKLCYLEIWQDVRTLYAGN